MPMSQDSLRIKEAAEGESYYISISINMQTNYI